jgi:hypothetical protein
LQESAGPKHFKKTNTSGTAKATIVAEYIVERLAAEGIDHWARRSTMSQVSYDKQVTALLVIDPYNDFISEGGKVWDRF